VTEIRSNTFFYCSSLAAISVDEGNTTYDSRNDCNAIIETSTNTLVTGSATTIIPEDVTSIAESAFSGRRGLTTITIPQDVTNIGDGAFVGCYGLSSIHVTEGNTIYDSRDNCNAIINSSSNTLLTGCAATIIPESVTSIANSAFEGCSPLESIIIPEGLTSIGKNAFAYCSNLTSIVFPKSIEAIGAFTFYECHNLTDVYCLAEVVPTTEHSCYDYNLQNTTLHVPSTAIENYKNSYPWSTFGNIVALTNEEMGIDNLEFRPQDSEPIYNLQGQRVANPTKGSIYIINGKKVAIK
jgi:hypothetical protein